MNLLGALGIFVRVAESGSFSAAARESDMTQPAVSRQIVQLEAHFGIRLLHRSTRRVALTEDGRELLGLARRLLDDVDQMETTLGGHREAATGVVRLGTSVAFGMFLAPRLPVLFARHPGLGVELLMRDEPCDMIEHRLDLATRGGEITDAALISRPFGTFRRIAVAAPAYLARRGSPVVPHDLRGHDCIIHLHTQGGTEWRFLGAEGGAVNVRVGGPLAVNNSDAAHLAVLAGQGIAMLPDIQVVDDIRAGRLSQVLGAYPTEPRAGYIVYPSRRHLPLRTRAVIDFLVDQARGLRAERQGPVPVGQTTSIAQVAKLASPFSIDPQAARIGAPTA